jgi:hypothetical protein
MLIPSFCFIGLTFRTFHTTMKLSDHIIKIDDAFITLPPPFEGSNHDLGPLSTAGTFILTLHGSKTKIYPCWRRPVCGPKIGSSKVQNRPFHYCNGQIRIQIWIKHILKYKSTRSHPVIFTVWNLIYGLVDFFSSLVLPIYRYPFFPHCCL